MNLFRIVIGPATVITFLVILILRGSPLPHVLWKNTLGIEEIEEGEENQEVEEVGVGLQKESVHEVPDSIFRLLQLIHRYDKDHGEGMYEFEKP